MKDILYIKKMLLIYELILLCFLMLAFLQHEATGVYIFLTGMFIMAGMNVSVE